MHLLLELPLLELPLLELEQELEQELQLELQLEELEMHFFGNQLTRKR